MAKSKKLFILFFLVLIFSAWIPFSGDIVMGEHDVEKKPVTLDTFRNKTAQKYLEAVWNRLFGFRNTLVRIKNTLYEGFNFGLFHANRNVIEGKGGRLNVSDYIKAHFCSNRKACQQHADKTMDAVQRLQYRLSDYGMPLLFILAPDRGEALKKYLPVHWKMLYEKNRNKIDWYGLYEKALADKGIPFLNLQKVIMAHAGEKEFRYFFWDIDTHWTKVGTGAILPEFVTFMNKYTGSHLVPPEKQLVFRKIENFPPTGDFFYAGDLLVNLNVYLKEWKKKSFPYYVFSNQAEQEPIALALYGDSYNREIVRGLTLSGMAHQSDITHYINKQPNQKEVYGIIERRVPVVLLYTFNNLTTTRIKGDIEHFLKQMDSVYFGDGWHGHEPGGKRWTSEKAETKFLSNGKTDMFFSMKLESKKPIVKSFTVSVNGEFIQKIALLDKNDGKIEIMLPKAVLKKGVNTIRFDVPEAASSRVLNYSGDTRIGGIYVSDVRVQPVAAE